MPPYVATKKRQKSPSPDRGSKSKRSKPTPSSSSARKPTLFDALDTPSASRRPSGKTKAILDKLADEEDSELSSLESTPEFNDVPLGGEDDDDDDEDVEFEDVQSKHTSIAGPSAPAPSGDLDLTLIRDTRINITNPHGDKKGPSKIERKIRIDTHCMHVQSLMWHNALRNSWLCDAEVQAILLSHLPVEMWAEVEKWRVRGIPGGAGKSKDAEADVKGKGKAKGKEKAGKGKKGDGRDWSNAAVQQEEGVVDMSHGDPLFKLMTKLSKWFKGRFRVTAPGLRKMGYMSLERLDQEIKSFREHESVADNDYDTELHGERIRNVDEFKECAQGLRGSRDVGAQLFTALLRGLGLEARMIASLQPVGFGWSKAEEAVERKEKKSKPEEPSLLEEGSDDGEDNTDDEIPVNKAPKPRKTKSGKAEPSATKTRGSTRGRKKSTPISLDSESEENSDVDDDGEESVVEVAAKSRGNAKNPPKVNGSKIYDKDLLFPHYWTEVLSPATQKYLAVDPLVLNIVATNAELLASFEPRGAKADKAKQVLTYVVGHSPDGTAKDVTVRYLKKHMWPGRTKGMRMTVEKIPIYGRHGKVKRYIEHDWFLAVMSGYVRGSEKCPRTELDDDEESTDLKAIKPEKKEVKEGEETLQSYKTSDVYVLERHLRREEAVVSTAKHVKMFTVKGKGGTTSQEKVFLRKDVVSCKSTETWHKEGREPKLGEEPRKRVPYRAATTNRKRELAEAEAASGGQKPLQGLFSIDQTDFITPPPIKDGIIPKNRYGNIDCYVPSMVPDGAVHLPYRGLKRVCNKLGIDFAEAVTGFEFGARMAVPIVTGVVVAEENAEMVLEQWQIDEAERVRKEDEKRQKFALALWRKFMMGLRIIERVREEYGNEADKNPDLLNPWTNRNKSSKSSEKVDDEAQRRIMEQREEEMAGGFFPEGMDVEEPKAFFPTHQEEEVGGGFFPMNDQEEDANGGGGGFVIENGEGDEQPMRFAYPTPASLKQHVNAEDPQNESDASVARPKAKQKAQSTKAKTPAPRKKSAVQSTPSSKSGALSRGRGRPAAKATPASSEAKGKRKRDPSEDEDEEDEDEDADDSSLLSDPEEDSEEDPRPAKKSRAKAKSPVTPRTRAAPKRGAAKKSEKAVRSHYFEGSEDDDE